MFEGALLGIIQGLTEWIPISSDGMITLAEINIFGKTDVASILQYALLLHLGTFFAALVYLRADVSRLLKTLWQYREAPREEKALLNFLIISTATSGVIGFGILMIFKTWAAHMEVSGKTLSAIVGFMLIATGVIHLVKRKKVATRTERELNIFDGVLLGLAQGIAALPGISRSGFTVTALLMRKFDDETALRISFLMSLPIVFAGNLALNAKELFVSFSAGTFVGILFAFLFGLATIHGLMILARKINFAWFALFFGVLTVIATLF